MGCSRISLLVVFLISVFHEVPGDHEMSQSPSPTPVTQPLRLPCDGVSDKCDIENYSVTACVTFVGNGSQVSYVTVLNNGESSLQLDIVVRPANVKPEGLVIITGHEVKKVNLPSNMRGDSSILLKVGNGECTIQLKALMPQGFYTSYMTPINGAYLLFAAVLFIGGSWACCKLVKRRRHLDGVPYQELEMEKRESNSTIAIETHDGWDQNWDDEWDEEKAVRSPGSIRTRNVSETGGSLKYVDTAQ